MAKIYIKCPKTGKLVYTTIQSDAQTFREFNLRAKTATTCPHCGGLHFWEKKDALLLNEDGTIES